MSTLSSTRESLLLLRPILSKSHPPTFLAPALATPRTTTLHQTSPFSTSHCRKIPDGNPNRGVSPMRRTGLKKPIGMMKMPLPKPVLDPAKRSKIETDPNHGLWGFFNQKKLLSTPKEDAEYGRSWTPQELRHKSWEDIHCLWWICCKELNRLATERLTRKRLQTGGGDFEGKQREKTVRQTQKAIKWALTERWYAWEDAWRMAKKDPEVDLEADLQTPAYKPIDDEPTIPRVGQASK